MSARKIEIEVSPEVAAAYGKATPDVRRKLDFLLRVQVLETLGLPRRSLDEIMSSASREAKARGLTPEVLQEILNER